MSIVETYKSQFNIVCFDEDLKRSEKFRSLLEKKGFAVTSYNSRGLFIESFENNLPHVVLMYYQPLSLKFRDTLTKLRQASDEVEIILFGTNDFWPGIHSLIKKGSVDDFWSWPLAGPEQVEIRLNKVIEKKIYQFIAEQRSSETQSIVESLEALRTSGREATGRFSAESPTESSLLRVQHGTESSMIEDFVGQMKTNYPDSEFIYFKNYSAKSQLLVTRTSFASENYFRGQSIPFNHERMQLDRSEALPQLRALIEDSFSCDDFLMQPIEFGDDFYGLLMAVNFEDTAYLQKNARYLALALRNFSLENNSHNSVSLAGDDVGIGKHQFPLSLSTEISRARRLKMPVSVIVARIEYVGSDSDDLSRAFDLIKNNLRTYDIVSNTDENQVSVILPHCRYEDAAIKAETIRRQLVAKGLKSQNTPLRLCFGVSEYPSLSQDSDSLLQDATKACLQVVTSGKNKVCLYSVEAGFEPEFQLNP